MQPPAIDDEGGPDEDGRDGETPSSGSTAGATFRRAPQPSLRQVQAPDIHSMTIRCARSARLLRKIADAYGTSGLAVPGLSISEYSSGCEQEIAGGIAQADLLGIFGREGVSAAAAWPALSLDGNYLVDLYRNYDGNGAVVGDTAVLAATSDEDVSSVYAFAHSEDPSVVELVAINKTSAPITATIAIAGAPPLAGASAYALVAGRPAVTPAAGAPPTVASAGGRAALTYVMAPMSATTLVLR
jgi:hypothetical protein